MTVKFQLNRPAVGQLLKSQAMQAELHRRAVRIAAAAGDGHEVEDFVGKNRARSTVRTTTVEAQIAQSAHQNLTRAIEAGR